MRNALFVLIFAVAIVFVFAQQRVVISQVHDWRSTAAVLVGQASLSVSSPKPNPTPSNKCLDCDGTGWNTTDGTMRIECLTCGGDGILDNDELTPTPIEITEEEDLECTGSS